MSSISFSKVELSSVSSSAFFFAAFFADELAAGESVGLGGRFVVLLVLLSSLACSFFYDLKKHSRVEVIYGTILH